VASLNVNGISRAKLGELLPLMSKIQLDVLLLLDTRHRSRDIVQISDTCKSALGHHSRVFFSPPLPQALPGGQITIVNHLWGRRVTDCTYDTSGLGLLSFLRLQSLEGSLLFMGTYWPSPSAPDDPERHPNGLAT